MIGLDTNVLVRYIMQDDPTQSRLASKLIESLTKERPGFISLVVCVELAWVLSVSYRLSREQVWQALDLTLRSAELVVEQASLVAGALGVFRSGSADFADCLIERSARAAGCERTMSFDRLAVKSAGMTLLG